MAALPNLDELLTDLHLTQLTTDLIQLSKSFFDESIVVLRNVRRIPPKVVETDDPIEQKHLNSSYDGLKYFIPVDIYNDNITAIDGLMQSFVCYRIQRASVVLIIGGGVNIHYSMAVWISSGNCCEHSIAIQLSQEYDMTYFSCLVLACISLCLCGTMG